MTVTPNRDREEWHTQQIAIPADSSLIHVRLHLPLGTVLVRSLELRSANSEVQRIGEAPARHAAVLTSCSSRQMA